MIFQKSPNGFLILGKVIRKKFYTLPLLRTSRKEKGRGGVGET
jgi:hypothetical protein